MEEEILNIIEAIKARKREAVNQLTAFFANESDPEALREALRLCAGEKALRVDDEDFYPAVAAAVQRVEDLLGDGTFGGVINKINEALDEEDYGQMGYRFSDVIAEVAMRRSFANIVFGALANVTLTAATTEG